MTSEVFHLLVYCFYSIWICEVQIAFTLECESFHNVRDRGSQGGEDVGRKLPDCNTVWSCGRLLTFRRNMSPPSFTSTQKMEVVRSSEKFVIN
jgi:hypothetical protein